MTAPLGKSPPVSRPHPWRARKLFGNCVLVLIATGFGIAATEAMVRILAPRFDPSGQVSFPIAAGPNVDVGMANKVFRQTKNTGDYDVAVRLNEAGFRDAPLASLSEADIYVVGDSFTWGWGVEEEQRYGNVLARSIGRRVRNVSAPTDLQGYGELLAWAKSHGARPRHVILGICMENDVRDYRPLAAPRQPDEDPPLSGIKLRLLNHSALYVLLTSTVHQSPLLKQLATRAGLVVENFSGMSRDPYCERAAFTWLIPEVCSRPVAIL